MSKLFEYNESKERESLEWAEQERGYVSRSPLFASKIALEEAILEQTFNPSFGHQLNTIDAIERVKFEEGELEDYTTSNGGN